MEDILPLDMIMKLKAEGKARKVLMPTSLSVSDVLSKVSSQQEVLFEQIEAEEEKSEEVRKASQVCRMSKESLEVVSSEPSKDENPAPVRIQIAKEAIKSQGFNNPSCS